MHSQRWDHAYETVDLPDTPFKVWDEIARGFGRKVVQVAVTVKRFDDFAGIRISQNRHVIYVTARGRVKFLKMTMRKIDLITKLVGAVMLIGTIGTLIMYPVLLIGLAAIFGILYLINPKL